MYLITEIKKNETFTSFFQIRSESLQGTDTVVAEKKACVYNFIIFDSKLI